jgi:tetratricopeptide (TPR) repeat protein
MGEYQEAKQYHDESLGLSKNAGDLYGTAVALAHLAQDVSFGLKDNKQGGELCMASLEIFKEIGSPGGVAGQLGDMAELMLMEKKYPQASKFAEEARTIHSSLGFESNYWEGRIIGGAAVGLGNIDKAKTYLRKSLEQAVKIHRLGYALITMIEVARLFMMQAKEERALELLALIMSHRSSWQMAKDKAAPLITELEAKLPHEVVAQARERGRARDLEKTVQELLDELKE